MNLNANTEVSQSLHHLAEIFLKLSDLSTGSIKISTSKNKEAHSVGSIHFICINHMKGTKCENMTTMLLGREGMMLKKYNLLRQ